MEVDNIAINVFLVILRNNQVSHACGFYTYYIAYSIL